MKVRIGRYPVDGDAQAFIDIERLVESRAIIQAASGFGKSVLLCELIEATHGHIQIIVVDPEGEFAPLRAKYDFVIAAASNGDALAHPRTAGLLATRLLETKASAILDIYDVKPLDRHEFVRNFIESLMNAPKALWHPVLVILDEAHLFCPEKGFGESSATDAVIDLAGRGRKRGFTLVAATQRIGKFNKNALAELNNKFIGSASLDVDVKRAAFELGKPAKEALVDLRALKPGEFYAFGPALQFQNPVLFRGDLPQTKLPKAGHRKLVAPPKPTAAIKALLPQLADIPKEVEAKAKTESELRKDLATANKEIGDLKRQREMDLRSLALTKPAVKVQKVNYKGAHREAKKFLKEVETKLMNAVVELNTNLDTVTHEWRKNTYHLIEHTCENALETIRQAAEAQVEISIEKRVLPPPEVLRAKLTERYKKVETLTPDQTNSEVDGPMQKILNAIAWLEVTNQKGWQSNNAVAFVAGYSPNGGGYLNPRGRLKQGGFIEYQDGNLGLTEKGRPVASWPTRELTKEEIHQKVYDRIDGPMTKILKPLIDDYPNVLSNEDVAAAAGYAVGGGGYLNPRGRLKTLGLIEYVSGGLRASKELFV